MTGIQSIRDVERHEAEVIGYNKILNIMKLKVEPNFYETVALTDGVDELYDFQNGSKVTVDIGNVINQKGPTFRSHTQVLRAYVGDGLMITDDIPGKSYSLANK